MRHTMIALTGSTILAFAQPALAQSGSSPPSAPPTTVAPQELTLERLFASPSLSGPTPRLPRLSPDGRLVTLLRNRENEKDRYDLWAVDASTGVARMLVDSTRVGTGAQVSEEEMMRRERARIAGVKGITDYRWAPDGRSILVPLDGDLYLTDLAGGVRRLTETAQTELDAEVSGGGKYISFVRDRNLFAIDAATGAERQLTQDGGGAISWGTAEFVANEEMDRDFGHWWSPDDRYVAVARVDETNVRMVPRAAIGADGTRVFEQRYPVAGSPNAVVDLYVMRPDGSGQVKVDLGSDTDVYLARVDWAGESLLVQRQSRDQKKLDLLRVDPATGRSQLLFSETSRTWVNLHSNVRALRDGSLIWSSERSGYQHLYRWRDGRFTQLTRGDWVVDEVQGVDERTGRVYFTGNADGPLEQHLYWVSYRNPAAPRRITDAGWWNEKIDMDERATRALVYRSNSGQPDQVYLADAEGRRIAWIEENAVGAGHPYAPFAASHVSTRFGTIAAEDGTTLHYKLLTPPLEPGRRYPVLVEVYGGPGTGRQATRKWASPRQQYLVDQGWIVFAIDNRGSPGRGKAFEDAIYQAMGGAEVRDQLAGLEWLKRQRFVDPERVGIYGWSYGGYMVTRLLEAAPGAYAAGIAGAPVTRWELYDTHYTERYLGNPSTDPAPYLRSGVIADVGRIADPLLIVHGMADDNVVFENSTTLIAALQAQGRPFELMVYPGATHAVSGEGRQLHLWRTITAFLERATTTAARTASATR